MAISNCLLSISMGLDDVWHLPGSGTFTGPVYTGTVLGLGQ